MNPYASRRQHLKLVRLPISPPPHGANLLSIPKVCTLKDDASSSCPCPGFDLSPLSGDNRKVASLYTWACGAVWERASMAWKRSSVRSRPGPPIKSIAYVEDLPVSHLQNVTCLRFFTFPIPYCTDCDPVCIALIIES